MLKIYVINLERSKERWKILQERFDELDLTKHVIRVDAVDGFEVGKKINSGDKSFEGQITERAIRNSNQKKRDSNPDLSWGAIGCAYSHIKAWGQILKGEEEFGCVMEDDNEIVDYFWNDINEICHHNKGGSDWDVLNAGAYFDLKDPSFQKDILTSSKTKIKYQIWKAGCLGLRCYVVRREFCQTLLDLVFPIHVHMDYWIDALRHTHRVFVLHPGINKEKHIYPAIKHTDVKFPEVPPFIRTKKEYTVEDLLNEVNNQTSNIFYSYSSSYHTLFWVFLSTTLFLIVLLIIICFVFFFKLKKIKNSSNPP